MMEALCMTTNGMPFSVARRMKSACVVALQQRSGGRVSQHRSSHSSERHARERVADDQQRHILLVGICAAASVVRAELAFM
jgi:hypothetical protein